MIRKPEAFRKYSSAHDRYLKPAIVKFFQTQFPGVFGPIIHANIADEIIRIVEENAPLKERVKHGQILWNALDKTTRADSPNRRYVPVTLDLVADEDITLLEKGVPPHKVREQVMARLFKQAYHQGGILSTRDAALMLCMDASHASHQRIGWEKKHQTVLPHTGVLHDMGSSITHKKQIVFKHVVEKKPTNTVARETNHSQRAVDRYIRDYNRVKTLFDDKKDIEFIHLATNIAKPVIRQYQDIIVNYVKDR